MNKKIQKTGHVSSLSPALIDYHHHHPRRRHHHDLNQQLIYI
jgi:hypothetical protein